MPSNHHRQPYLRRPSTHTRRTNRGESHAISECPGQPFTEALTLIANRPFSVREVAASATDATPGDPDSPINIDQAWTPPGRRFLKLGGWAARHAKTASNFRFRSCFPVIWCVLRSCSFAEEMSRLFVYFAIQARECMQDDSTRRNG